MKNIIFALLISIFSGCGSSSDDSANRKVIDDSSIVTNFMISLDNGGTKMMVLATKNKDSIIYASFMKHKNELGLMKSEVNDRYPSFRVFNYKGQNARYTLIAPNYDVDHDWYMLCPYHINPYAGEECILSGKIDEYVFQTYIPDLNKFGLIVSAIKVQSRNLTLFQF